MSRSGTYATCRMYQKFHAGYRCSKCGGRNVFLHEVLVTGRAESDDPYVSAGAKLHLQNLAEIQAKELLRLRVEDIFREQKYGVYRTARYNHKCSHCGHREPWSRLRFDGWKNLAPIVGLIGAIAVLFAFSAGTAAGVAALAALASVIALPFGVNRLLLSLREKQIADLPPHAKPMLTTDPKNPQFFAHLGY